MANYRILMYEQTSIYDKFSLVNNLHIKMNICYAHLKRSVQVFKTGGRLGISLSNSVYYSFFSVNDKAPNTNSSLCTLIVHTLIVPCARLMIVFYHIVKYMFT